MIRKNLLLTLLMALFVPLAAWAQIVPTNLECLLNPTDPTVAYMKWWTPTGYESNWLLQFSTRSDFPDNPSYTWTRYVYDVPQYRLTGLTPETTYYVRVKDRAGSGSQYSNTFTFTPVGGHQIGNQLAIMNKLPCNNLTVGGFSVQAYDKSTIPEGYINKISFYCWANGGSVSRDIKIYLSQGENYWGWSYVTSWHDLGCDHNNKLVFDGTKTFVDGWNEIEFSQPYRYWKYDESPGLFVFFVDETGSSSSGSLAFGHHVSDMWGGLYGYGDLDLRPLVSSWTRTTKVDNTWCLGYGVGFAGAIITDLNECTEVNTIRLGFSEIEDDNVSISVYNPDVIGEGRARLRWNGSHAQHYVLQYGTSSSFASNLTTTKYLYDRSFDLSNLSPTQTYYWRVKAVGAFNETDWSVGTSFKPTKQVVVTGNTTEFASGTPTSSSTIYYLSQQIYTKAEMTKAGIVESVTFECLENYNTPRTRNLDIYMVHTNKSSFADGNDWESVTPDDLVFSGPVTFQGGLNTIRFNSGFEYDGQRNVVLVVDDNTGVSESSPLFKVFNVSTHQALAYSGWYSNIDVFGTLPESSSTSAYQPKKNCVTFEINTPSGMNKPTGLAATLDPDTPTEATLGWTENGTATRWDVRYGTDPSFADCQTMEVSDTPQAQLTGLTPETTYYAQVRSLKNSVSAWSAPIAFVPTDKIVVGAGEAISSSLPIVGYLTCVSQQIYTANELLNEPRLIESVSFYCENKEFTRSTVGIFMMHTDKEVFDNTNDMLDTDNAEMVYNGAVSFVAGDWTTINFTTPFAYDGTSNVVLSVADFSGSQSLGGFPNFKAFETGSNQAIYWFVDTGSPMTQLSTKKNQVRWGCSAVCEAIYHHPEQVAYFPGNSADVWWFEMGEATEWTVQHGPNANFTEGSYTEQNVTGEPYIELKNLTPNSVGQYYVRVRSVCGEGFHSFWSDVITLRPEASNEICDGGGSSTDVLPASPNYYNYYLSQQIYTRQELRNMPCAIGSVEFGWQNTAFPVRNLDIYMVHTDKTQFDSKSDWVQVTADDLVFSGETTFGHSTITFDKRFMYDGTSNVVLVVNDKTGATDANASELYYVFETENNQALYAGSNYGNIDPLGTLFAAEGLVNMKNCVTFGWEENPVKTPTMHEATLTPNNATVATLNWTENGAATEWVLQYAASDEFGYNFEELLGEITVTGTPTFNLTGLTPWTYYQARVKAVYREGDAEYHSGWSQTAMFMTEQKIDVGTEMQDWVMDLPTHIYYNYSYTQQIYTKDELLNKSCIIRSVDFMKTYDNTSRKLKVYMVHTDKEEFDNVNDWLTVTADNLVFNGYAYFQKDEWSTITFDTPFEYNGTSNVALVVYDETGESHNVGTKFKCFSGSKNRAIGMTSSSSIDPLSANPGNATVVNSFRNKVRFGREEYPAIVVSPGQPYVQGFETPYLTGGWIVSDGWNTYYPYYALGGYGTHCAHASNGESLISPEIGFDESCDNVIIRFWAKCENEYPDSYDNAPELAIYSSEDDFASIENRYYLPRWTVNTWTEYVFSLCGYMSGSVKIEFNSNSISGFGVDDIEIVANAYDKVLYSSSSIAWEENNFYPQGLPTYDDDVLVCADVILNETLGTADNIEFGTDGKLTVASGTTLSLNSGLSKITANTANALIVNGIVNVDELVPQAEGSVVVNDGGVINATTITGVNSENFVINDGGQVYCSTPFHGTFKKDITGYGAENVNSRTGWYLIASPLDLKLHGTLILGMDDQYDKLDVYRFCQQCDLEWDNPKFTNSSGYTLIDSRELIGFPKAVLYAYQDDITIKFESVNESVYNYNNILININIPFLATTTDFLVDCLDYYTNADFVGWNLIGNPYTANAYVKDAEGNYMAYYRMNADGDRIVLAEAGTPIKPCEGVFVQVSKGSTSYGEGIGFSGTPVTFTTTQPQPESGRGAIDFTLSKHSSTRNGANVVADRARISFSEGEGMGHLDLMADANRLYIPQSGKDMAVVCSEPAGEMPLNFEAAENGTYTLGISLNDTELVYCHLIDNLTGADVDLLATSTGSVAEYTFEAKTTDYASRFKVVFAAKSAFEGDNASNFAFFTQGNWIIANEGRATLQVIDMNGRILSSESINGNATTQINAAAGMYLLRLVNGNDVKTQKILVE